ncbi:MAG: BMP family ABC transporter substrate-binding protein [Anaerolineales bacterium]|jgi:basic membrane lipoprotein Med (substrate-binding protein (PBP1-ABC) superfamily)|nr:BMP family ABC transporter substrate-binding protein [Anaerolineales bacterium]
MSGFARFLRAAGLFASLVFAIAPAGCLPVPPECPSADVVCVGFVTDRNGLEDYGLNEQAWQILEPLRQDGVVVERIESIDSYDYEKNVAYFADRRYDLIFTCGYDLVETTLLMAEKYPDVSFVMLGQAPEEKKSPSNLAGVIFPAEQAGYLIGTLMARFSETGIVGAVFANPEIPTVGAYARGFEAGAQGLEVHIASYQEGRFAASLSDSEWGEAQAQSLESLGADVLFAYGGNTGISALKQARGRVIGVEMDFARRYPSMDNRLVASLVFDFSILKEIVRAGRISQPIYEGGYKILWGDVPVPGALDGEE